MESDVFYDAIKTNDNFYRIELALHIEPFAHTHNLRRREKGPSPTFKVMFAGEGRRRRRTTTKVPSSSIQTLSSSKSMTNVLVLIPQTAAS